MLKLDTLVKFTCIAVLSEVLYHVSRRMYLKYRRASSCGSLTNSLKKRYSQEDEISEAFHKVLFFPDAGIACRRERVGRVCKDKSCSAVHEDTSLSVLLNLISFTCKTLDVCVYMITSAVLKDALVECHERGTVVRVITEERNSGEEGEMVGSQIGKLRAAGIAVRCSCTSFWMHHKFLIADGEVLVNGSFNWTNQAVMGNLENLIITNEKQLVHPFVAEFQNLWEKLATDVSNDISANGDIRK